MKEDITVTIAPDITGLPEVGKAIEGLRATWEKHHRDKVEQLRQFKTYISVECAKAENDLAKFLCPFRIGSFVKEKNADMVYRVIDVVYGAHESNWICCAMETEGATPSKYTFWNADQWEITETPSQFQSDNCK